MAQNVVRLGGRHFAGISQDITAAQEEYLSGHLRRCGALEALSDAALSEEKRGEEMLTRIMCAGETFAILAGCLVEAVIEGELVMRKKWRRAEAERNAAFFAEITDEESKRAIRGELVALVLGFLGYAGKSSATSPSSSSPKSADRATASAAPATTETSPGPSAPSEGTTQTASAG